MEVGVLGVAARPSWDQVEFQLEHDPTKGKENIMMECTYGATPKELLERPIGLFALHGRDGDDDAKSDDDDEDKSGDDAKSDEDDEKDDDAKKGKGTGETVETLTRKLASAEEARNRAADKRDEYKAEVATLTAKIAKMEKDGSPDETIKAENQTLTATNSKLVKENEGLRLDLALRDDKAHSWVDPSKVLKLLDLSEVDFDAKTGQPRGLKAALDKLAKDSPYLLTPKDDEHDDTNSGKPAPRGTGQKPAPKGAKGDAAAAARAAELRKKYPALRRF